MLPLEEGLRDGFVGQRPGEGLGQAADGALIRQRQVLEMLGQEEGAALQDENARAGVVGERSLREPERAEAAADDDEVEVVLLPHLLPVALRHKEDVVHHRGPRRRLRPRGRKAVVEVRRRRGRLHRGAGLSRVHSDLGNPSVDVDR